MTKLPDINSESVFKVNTSNGTGSSFYLKNRNILVTNFHVVQGHRMVAIEDQNKFRYLAKVVFVNPREDLAFLQPSRKFKQPHRTFDSFARVKNREQVYVLGYPFGMPYTETEGIVSSSRQLMEGRYYIQTDAAVNPGNSGGPVVNSNGELVGITTSKFTNADNVGFAIPVDVLQEDLDSFRTNREFTYSVKCNSCKQLIFTKTEYCSNCGNTIDPEVFDQVQPNRVSIFIEEALKMLGMDPVLARGGEDYWEFYFGSTLVTIYFQNREYLYVMAPINELPIVNVESLFKYILSSPLPTYKLGILDNKIFLSYRLHMSDVFSQFGPSIRRDLAIFPLKANELSHYFIKHYGCTMSNYSRLSDMPGMKGHLPE